MYSRARSDRVEVGGRADAQLLRHRRAQLPGTSERGVAEEDGLLAVAREARLHEQLDVAVGVGAGHVEAAGAPARAIAHEVLDQAEADVTGIALIDRVELDDGPLVAVGVAFDAREPERRPPSS